MKVTWFGHSCFMAETAEGSVVFDPYSPGYIPGIEMPVVRADAVICSHGHGDHNYAAGVQLTGNKPAFGLVQLDTFHDEAGGTKRGKNTVSLIEAEGLRLAHMGDLGHELSAEQIEALGRVDVLLIPVGGFYTIDAAAAKKVADSLGAKIVIPMHYSGDGFGLNEIARVEEYLKQVSNFKRIDCSSVEINGEEESCTLVLKCPVK